MTDQIIVRGARLHNLKNITISIPKNKLVVLSGVSGSGKSSLGFDILLKEGQRQYLEALGLIGYGMAKPPVDSITGLSPTISVDQGQSNRSPRSTVGTSTDIYTYLRALFARLGHRCCQACNGDVPAQTDASITAWEVESAIEESSKQEVSYPCPHCKAPVRTLGMANFSFNKPEGACQTCTGLGTIQQVNLSRLVDEDKNLLDGAVATWDTNYINYYVSTLKKAAEYFGFAFDPLLPIKQYTPQQRDLLLYGVDNPIFRRHFLNIAPPVTVRQGKFEGLTNILLRRYAEHVQDADYLQKMEEYLITQDCPDCAGTRLNIEARSVTIVDKTIIDVSRLPLSELNTWLSSLRVVLNTDEMRIAEPIIMDIGRRIIHLSDVGAGYLTLERSSPSLSAGESQRLRLASLLGSGLCGLLYVFDEPTIGLHHRDTQCMIDLLRRLRDFGNSVIVIEHDLDMIAGADFVIDIGPGAGKYGGEVVAYGSPAELALRTDSITGEYLAGRASIQAPVHHRPVTEKSLTVHGAHHHNLQNITVKFPLGLLVAVTGVSGSGKSSLVFDILDRALRKRLYGSNDVPGEHDDIEGYENLDQVITIDQYHIGRIPRSNAATYTDAFTPIRQVFASTDEARRRGYSARHFSFNVPGGRCERCQGTGVLMVEMHFLPDVEVRCPVCQGKRFTQKTLEVQFRGCDISQVLDMTVEEALELFTGVPAATSRLKMLSEVGLGYLQLGQPATTLSGGEAQRIKLAKELGRRVTGRALYLLDEPTRGLHLADIARLLGVLQRLVAAGSSVIVVEHNLDVIKTADWVIDLGPEGGSEGGKLVAQGTPEQVALTPGSYTGESLREILKLG